MRKGKFVAQLETNNTLERQVDRDFKFVSVNFHDFDTWANIFDLRLLWYLALFSLFHG